MLSDRDAERRRRWSVDIYEVDLQLLTERARIDGYAGAVSLWIEAVLHLLGSRPDVRLPFPPHPRIPAHQRPGRQRLFRRGYVISDIAEEVLRVVEASDIPLTSVQAIRRLVGRGLGPVNAAVRELLEAGRLLKIGRVYRVERRFYQRRVA